MLDHLIAALDEVRASPPDEGVVELIVRRPAPGEREVLDRGELSTEVGLVGDGWSVRPSSSTPDGGPHPNKQVTLVNARFTAALGEGDADRRLLCGDQLHVDLDLGVANLPPGTRLAVGGAVLEVSAEAHRGCANYAAHYGADVLRFVNLGEGAALRLRGVNTRVLTSGPVATGDVIRKLP